MAPLNPEITDLSVSSLELDSRSSAPTDLTKYLETLSLDKREALTYPDALSSRILKRSPAADLSLPQSLNLLTSRDAPQSTNTQTNHGGAINPSDINMKGIQALIAIIGVAFVLGIIWFFFWAKNGGFQWRKGDWDEYKSTVLRRKGPNGTTLSNATKSTRLGGGSVVGQGYSDRDGYSDETGTVITGTMTELSSSTAPIIKEKQSKKKSNNKQKENPKERKQREMQEAQWEGGHDNDVRAYRHEKAARVGGLNKNSDGLYYGTDYTDTEGSSVGHNPRPASGQHRSSRNASPEKRTGRRDFSYTGGADEANFSSDRAPSPPPMRVPQNQRPSRYHSPPKQTGNTNNRASMPGSYYDGSTASSDFARPMDFNSPQSQHTKSYHHPMPGLNGGGRAGGFRRDRGDGLDD